jgi:hypothetical protein
MLPNILEVHKNYFIFLMNLVIGAIMNAIFLMKRL